MLEPYRKPGPKRIGLYLSLWASLALTAFIGGRFRGLGARETLRRSPFARTMFADIGALSTVASLYVALRYTSPLRFVAAILTLFIGSFALLPYLAWEDYRAWKKAGKLQGE